MSDEDWNRWNRLAPDSIVENIDMVRCKLGDVCEAFEMDANVDELVVAELWRINDPNHLCSLLWDKSLDTCRGILTGDFTTGPAGESIFRVCWVHFIALGPMELSPKSDKCLLDEYMKSLGVQAVVIESPRPPKVIARWDHQFKEVARVYRREVA